MTFEKIIILACSRKLGGKCIAGKLLNGNKWIRPVSRYGTLMESQITYSDGSLPKVLDIVKIPIGPKVTNEFQPENFLIKNGQWEKVGNFSDTELDKLCDDYSDIFFNYSDRVPESLIKKPNGHSLMLIKPQSIKIVRKNTTIPSFKKRVRAEFKYKERKYDIPITDHTIEEEYLKLDVGEYILDDNPYYLCLSLGNPFVKDNCCYKFVASIIEAGNDFKKDFTGHPVKDTNLSYKEKLIEASKKRKQERLKIHKKKPRHLHKFSDWK